MSFIEQLRYWQLSISSISYAYGKDVYSYRRQVVFCGVDGGTTKTLHIDRPLMYML